jgi:hypothetical protein
MINPIQITVLVLLVVFSILGLQSMDARTEKWACEESLPRNVECVYQPPVEIDHE